MQPVTVYHNESCSKSNAAVSLLREHGVPFIIRNYIEQPLTAEELKVLLAKLALSPFDIVRKAEPLYLENWQDKQLSDEEWLIVLAENPSMIERPIVETKDRAIVARPSEKIFELPGLSDGL